MWKNVEWCKYDGDVKDQALALTIMRDDDKRSMHVHHEYKMVNNLTTTLCMSPHSIEDGN